MRRVSTTFLIFLIVSLVFTFNFYSIPITQASPTYEDFTDSKWTEHDGLTSLTVTTNKAEWSSSDYRTGTDNYLSGDYGANHFKNFSHTLETKLISTDDNTLTYRGGILFYVEQDVADDMYALKNNNYEIIVVLWAWNDGTNKPYIQTMEYVDNSNIDSDTSTDLELNTEYALNVTRSGTAFSVEIEGEDTLSLTLDSGIRYYQRIQVASSLGYANTRNSAGYIENLDLYEEADETEPLWQEQSPVNGTTVEVGGELELKAQGYDIEGLDWAWLETNETTSMKNYTYFDSRGFYLTNWTKSPNNPIVDPLDNRVWCTIEYYEVNSTHKWHLYMGHPSTGSNVTYWYSSDGENFAKWGDVLTIGASPSWNDTALEPHSIINFEGEWRLYYGAKNSSNLWASGYAVIDSTDWSNLTCCSNNPVLIPTGDEVDCADPHAVVFDGKVWCYYADWQSNWVVNIAWSDDGETNWNKLGTWLDNYTPSDLMNYTINGTDGLLCLMRNHTGGIEEGYPLCAYWSTDGENFTVYSGNPVFEHNASIPWEYINLAHSDLVKVDSTYYLYYGAQNETNDYHLGRASTTTISQEGLASHDPMDMGGVTDWTWSNFTWSNSSLSAGTKVLWRIYYNDTSGNENVTDTRYFLVTSGETEENVFSSISINESSATQRTWTSDRDSTLNLILSLDNFGLWSLSRFTSLSQQYTVESIRSFAVNIGKVIVGSVSIVSKMVSSAIKNFFASILHVFSLSSQKNPSFVVEKTIGSTFTILSAFESTVQKYLFGSITETLTILLQRELGFNIQKTLDSIFNINREKSVSFPLYPSINSQFSIGGHYISEAIKNFFGSVSSSISIQKIVTLQFNRFLVLSPVFNMQTMRFYSLSILETINPQFSMDSLVLYEFHVSGAISEIVDFMSSTNWEYQIFGSLQNIFSVINSHQFLSETTLSFFGTIQKELGILIHKEMSFSRFSSLSSIVTIQSSIVYNQLRNIYGLITGVIQTISQTTFTFNPQGIINPLFSIETLINIIEKTHNIFSSILSQFRFYSWNDLPVPSGDENGSAGGPDYVPPSPTDKLKIIAILVVLIFLCYCLTHDNFLKEKEAKPSKSMKPRKHKPTLKPRS